MAKVENSKVVAAVSISILLASVLCNPIQSVFADISHVNEINNKKKLAEEQAKEYLKNIIPAKPEYWKISSTTTNTSGKNVKADLDKAKQASEEKAKQYLKTIGPLKKNLAAKIRYTQLNYTSTDESGTNAKAELEKAKKTSEEKAMETLEKLFPKLARKKP